jgi:hypothetical protein
MGHYDWLNRRSDPFHDLLHRPFTRACFQTPGGPLRHLRYWWLYVGRPAAGRRLLCPLGHHVWVPYFRNPIEGLDVVVGDMEEAVPDGLLCERCGPDRMLAEATPDDYATHIDRRIADGMLMPADGAACAECHADREAFVAPDVPGFPPVCRPCMVDGVFRSARLKAPKGPEDR